MSKHIYCHECSMAGGADRAIYHDAPACVPLANPSKMTPMPAAPLCECGLCVDCMQAEQYAILMDEARARLCNVCGEQDAMTQGACYDCCRLCTQCGDEPRHPTSLVCDTCLAKTIKPVSNVPVRGELDPPWWGAYANVAGVQDIILPSTRQHKCAHLRRACHTFCGYCYEEGMEYLRKKELHPLMPRSTLLLIRCGPTHLWRLMIFEDKRICESCLITHEIAHNKRCLDETTQCDVCCIPDRTLSISSYVLQLMGVEYDSEHGSTKGHTRTAGEAS